MIINSSVAGTSTDYQWKSIACTALGDKVFAVMN